MAQAAPAKQNKKMKKQPIKLNFSELDDLFLNQKGKQLRNLQKKLDKYLELDGKVRNGDLPKPNQQQKEQIASIPSLRDEMTELDTLCRLYMESNPNFDKSSPSISQEDVDRAVRDALTNVIRVQSLSALSAEDSSLVEMSDSERDFLAFVMKKIDKMHEDASQGSASFQAHLESQRDVVDFFTKMASSSSDEACDGGSYADFNSFVNKCFGEDDSGIAQRISAKAEEAKKAAEAAEEAARVAEEAQKKADAAAAKEAARLQREQERAAALEAKKAAQAESAQNQEAKDTSEVNAEGQKDVAAAAEGQQEAAAYTDSRGGRGGRGDRGDRGDRRGGRREYDGERQPRREYDPERRGRGRGGEYRGRGRGGYRQNKNEDDEGFVVETGEKPKRGRGTYRGRGRGGERGEFRGGRGDRGDRGDRRGGDWDRNNRGRGGERPQTADGGENAAAAQETQPAAQIGTKASTTNKEE